MNLNRLRYFVTVVETGSMRRASELLHITPAALSKAITQLERETGLTLLVPAGRGIQPSRRGLSLAHHARRVLDEVETLEAHAAQGAESRTLVRVGTFEVFGTYFLGRLSSVLGEQVSLVVHSMSPGDVEQGVADGAVDVGMTFAPVANDAVEHRRLGSVAMGVYARPGAFDGVEFGATPFVVPTRRLSGGAARASTSDGWPIGAPLRNVVHQVGTMEAALELTRQGCAACYVPAFVAELHNEQVRSKYRIEPLAGAPLAGATLDVHGVQPVGRQASPEVERAIGALGELVVRLGAVEPERRDPLDTVDVDAELQVLAGGGA